MGWGNGHQDGPKETPRAPGVRQGEVGGEEEQAALVPGFHLHQSVVADGLRQSSLQCGKMSPPRAFLPQIAKVPVNYGQETGRQCKVSQLRQVLDSLKCLHGHIPSKQ